VPKGESSIPQRKVKKRKEESLKGRGVAFWEREPPAWGLSLAYRGRQPDIPSESSARKIQLSGEGKGGTSTGTFWRSFANEGSKKEKKTPVGKRIYLVF